MLRTSSKGAASRKQACLLLRGSSLWLPLSPSDRAFAQRIFRETVVWKKYLDFVLNRYTSQPVSKLDQDIVRSLRIGAAQLLILKTPAHAAVSATVEAHERKKTRGLVNAVLRKVAGYREKSNIPLHIRYSHPEALVKRWAEQLGADKTQRLLQWNNTVPELGGYAFGDLPENSTSGKYLEKYRLLERGGRFDPPEDFYIQDESAAVVGFGMSELPGDSVLELGAAPGGKTAHLAEKGTVFAIDAKPDRMKRWQENSRRLGWKNCMGIAAESEKLPFSGRFSKVIADVPCTNTGVYRRRSDARWNWTQTLHNELIGIQRRMLQESSAAVEKGGVLIYSTCSIDCEENQEAAFHFEENNDDFRRVDFPGPDALVNSQGFLSYFPPDAMIDGLFAAAWIRQS